MHSRAPLLAETPAVAVTARGDGRKALAAGFDAHLGTPVDPWELCDGGGGADRSDL